MSNNGQLVKEKAAQAVDSVTNRFSRAVRTKRTSVAVGEKNRTAFNEVKGLFNQYSQLGYLLPWESLDYIELLAQYNPDYSQAVDNIQTLANSGHELFVEAPSKRATERLKSLLEEKARTIQAPHGGVDGLIDKLLAQGATYGAMCFSAETEIITLEGVRQIGELAGTTQRVLTRGGRWMRAPISSFGNQRLWKVELQKGSATKTVNATAEHRWILEAKRSDAEAHKQRGYHGKVDSWERDAITSQLQPGDRLKSAETDQAAVLASRVIMSPFAVAQGITFGDGCAPINQTGNVASAELALSPYDSISLLKWFPLSATSAFKGGLKVRHLPRSWKELPSPSESASFLMGWAAGYFAADGCVGESGQCSLTSVSREAVEFFRNVLVRLGAPCGQIGCTEGRGGGCVEERDYGRRWRVGFDSSWLPESFFIQPKHLERRRSQRRKLRCWKVVSVEPTERVEEVFCATVPQTSCFALEGNILTGNCGEWVANEDLTDIVDFVDVNPKSIRFFWGEEEQRWLPFQKVTMLQAKEAKDRGQEVRGDCIRLNELTFRYFAFGAAPGSPYGTPPFLASLANIAIQRDMIHNMSQIVKKVGLLGIIDMVVKQLPPRPGESDEDYMARAEMYLDDYANVVEDMVREGGVVHYDDVEITTTNVSGNAAGATNIFKQNEELIFSGLKSMPSVQGRSYSTTETYAGVAYDIIIRNTRKYQRACKRMIEAGYWLIATLNGEQPDSITLDFHDNKTLHRLHTAQAEQIELRNGLILWETGIIDQIMFGQRFGYASPIVPMEWPTDVEQQPDTSTGPDRETDNEAPAASSVKNRSSHDGIAKRGRLVREEIQGGLAEAGQGSPSGGTERDDGAVKETTRETVPSEG